MLFKNIVNQFKNKLKDYTKYIAIFIIILLTISFTRNIIRIKKSNKQIVEKEEEVESLIQENNELKAKLENVQTSEFIEKQLRDKLGLAREGEVVVVLPEDEVLRKFAPKREEEEEFLPDPNWKKWLKLFF